MNYEEALKAIQFQGQAGSILRLSTMEVLLGATGNPQAGMRYIHVAGTNGKGSVSQYLYSILIAAGYKVGMYTSPSMVSFNERMQINRELISDEHLIALADGLKSRLQDADVAVAPTEFEWITALAFHYFHQQACDFVILEVGLGGRLDATNVIDKPLVSVITKIGLDHQDVLGETLEEITCEKAGIIKEGVPVVVYPLQESGVIESLEGVAQAKAADLVVPDVDQLTILTVDPSGQQFSYRGLDGLQLNMLGIHQFYNAVTSLEAIFILRDRYGVSISDVAIREGLAASRMIGRFEKVHERPTVILDGAHNPQGVAALVASIRQLFPGKKLVAVVGVLKDKNLAEMIGLIDELVISYQLALPDSTRSFTLDEMAAIISENSQKPLQTNKYLRDALASALDLAGEDGLVVCFGSLYLIAEAYTFFNK